LTELSLENPFMEKVLFALDIDDGWPPVATEAVWCERVDDNYRLLNAPFLSKVSHTAIFFGDARQCQRSHF